MRLVSSLQYRLMLLAGIALISGSAQATEGVMRDSAILYEAPNPYYIEEEQASTLFESDVQHLLSRMDEDEELSLETRRAMERVLRTLPPPKDEPIPMREQFTIKHGNLEPEVDVAPVQEATPKVPSRIEISVIEAKPDKASEAETLSNAAYDAFNAQQMESAIALYKEALENEPRYPIALYGLATTYQHLGQLTQARDAYTDLLGQEWNKEQVMENFLSLVSEEAPKDAITEIKKLLRKNPSYAPAHAQLGLLYARFNEMDKATRHAKEAIRKSPYNLQYRYNLAVMFDQMKQYEDAAKLYLDVLNHVRDGKEFIGSIQALEDRYTFLSGHLGE